MNFFQDILLEIMLACWTGYWQAGWETAPLPIMSFISPTMNSKSLPHPPQNPHRFLKSFFHQ